MPAPRRAGKTPVSLERSKLGERSTRAELQAQVDRAHRIRERVLAQVCDGDLPHADRLMAEGNYKTACFVANDLEEIIVERFIRSKDAEFERKSQKYREDKAKYADEAGD